MNVLYIAYSCSPFHGSEDKIGWNVPVQSAKHNSVIVITKEEQREYIEKYLQNNLLENVRFIYVDIPAAFKKLFRGMLYSGRLTIWNRIAYKVAKALCKKEQIDIIHQITPVEFRNIGSYGKIPGVKFICGPIAGGQNTPKALRKYADGHICVEYIRTWMNTWSKCIYRWGGRFQRCSHLMIANRETKEYINHPSKLSCAQSILTDVSVARGDLCPLQEKKRPAGKMRFLVVGRLVYLKGHAFLLDALARLPADLQYTCTIVGDGGELSRLKEKCAQYHLTDKVHFLGAIPYEQIEDLYRQSDVLIMPSLREATGSVLLEAMANGLPVITINRFGGADIVTCDTGWLYDGQTQEECVIQLADALRDCIIDSQEVIRKGENARKAAEGYTWEARLERYQSIYEEVLAAVSTRCP